MENGNRADILDKAELPSSSTSQESGDYNLTNNGHVSDNREMPSTSTSQGSDDSNLLRQPSSLLFRIHEEKAAGVPRILRKLHEEEDPSDYRYDTDDECLIVEPSTHKNPHASYTLIIRHDNDDYANDVKKCLGPKVAEVTNMLPQQSHFDIENLKEPTSTKEIDAVYDVASEKRESALPIHTSDNREMPSTSKSQGSDDSNLLRQPSSLLFRNHEEKAAGVPQILRKLHEEEDPSDYRYDTDDECLIVEPSTSQNPLVSYRLIIRHDSDDYANDVKKCLGSKLKDGASEKKKKVKKCLVPKLKDVASEKKDKVKKCLGSKIKDVASEKKDKVKKCLGPKIKDVASEKKDKVKKCLGPKLKDVASEKKDKVKKCLGSKIKDVASEKKDKVKKCLGPKIKDVASEKKDKVKKCLGPKIKAVASEKKDKVKKCLGPELKDVASEKKDKVKKCLVPKVAEVTNMVPQQSHLDIESLKEPTSTKEIHAVYDVASEKRESTLPIHTSDNREMPSTSISNGCEDSNLLGKAESSPTSTASKLPNGPLLRQPSSPLFRNHVGKAAGVPQTLRKLHEEDEPSTSQKPLVSYTLIIRHDSDDYANDVKKCLGPKLKDVASEKKESTVPIQTIEIKSSTSDSSEASVQFVPEVPRKQNKKKSSENLFGNVETTAIDIQDSDSSAEEVKSPNPKRRRLPTAFNTFKCNFCPKEFGRHWMLESHERIHTGEKPFKCDFCEAAFAHNSNLVAHKRLLNHHNWKYKCELCQKPFSKANYMRRHNPNACKNYLKKSQRRRAKKRN